MLNYQNTEIWSITRSVFVPLTYLDSVKVSSTDISPLIYHLVSEIDQITKTNTQEMQCKRKSQQ